MAQVATLAGAVEILESSHGQPQLVAVHQPLEFTGDVDMLTGRSALVTRPPAPPPPRLRFASIVIKSINASLGFVTRNPSPT